jgi:hypothetical protein
MAAKTTLLIVGLFTARVYIERERSDYNKLWKIVRSFLSSYGLDVGVFSCLSAIICTEVAKIVRQSRKDLVLSGGMSGAKIYQTGRGTCPAYLVSIWYKTVGSFSRQSR